MVVAICSTCGNPVIAHKPPIKETRRVMTEEEIGRRFLEFYSDSIYTDSSSEGYALGDKILECLVKFIKSLEAEYER